MSAPDAMRAAEFAYNRAARERDSLACVIVRNLRHGDYPSAALMDEFTQADTAATAALIHWQELVTDDEWLA